MLKKTERLTKKEFDRFFASGRRYHNAMLSLVYSPAPEFHGAVVVGKKIYKKAVDRNRLRRRLYNIIYRMSREKNLKGVYIVLTKAPAKEVNFSVLRTALEDIVTLTNNK